MSKTEENLMGLGFMASKTSGMNQTPKTYCIKSFISTMFMTIEEIDPASGRLDSGK